MSSFFFEPTVDPGADVSFFLVPREPNDQLSSLALLDLAELMGKGQSVLEKSDLEVRSVVEQEVRRRGGEENKPPVPPFALLLIPELEQEEDVVEHVDVVVEDDDDAVPFNAWSCALAANAFSYKGPGWLRPSGRDTNKSRLRFRRSSGSLMAEDGTKGRLLADGGRRRLSNSDADSDDEMME